MPLRLRPRCLELVVSFSGYDDLTYRSQFQQETMASQIRYYKTRHQQLKHFVERLKRDVAELKKYMFTSTQWHSQVSCLTALSSLQN